MGYRLRSNAGMGQGTAADSVHVLRRGDDDREDADSGGVLGRHPGSDRHSGNALTM